MKVLGIICRVLMIWLIGNLAYAGQYTILIDAGSSGSKLRLFQYETQSSLPDIKEVSLKVKEVKPGLSSYANQPEAAGPSLKPLLDEVMTTLQSKSVNPNTVNISILATAGMRLLSPSEQERIYSHVKKYLGEKYPFSIGEIKTIDGKMEGIYGWLTVNYLQKTFLLRAPSVGSIDMGGASTQIAFETSDASPSPDKAILVINGLPHIVFSKSFLGLGQDKARGSMNKHEDAASCYPEGYELKPESKIGFFDLQKCALIYNQLLQPETIRKQLIPFPEGHFFIAYSGVYYVYDFFKANWQTPLLSQIQKVCKKKWSDLLKEYPDNPHLLSFCANGVYIRELLQGVYKIPESRMTAVNKINQQSIDWTLGALLYQLVEKDIHWLQQIQIRNVTSSGATISWASASSLSPVVYDVDVRGPGGNIYSNIKGEMLEVKGLQPSSPYTVKVIANNGKSQIQSDDISFHTAALPIPNAQANPWLDVWFLHQRWITHYLQQHLYPFTWFYRFSFFHYGMPFFMLIK